MAVRPHDERGAAVADFAMVSVVVLVVVLAVVQLGLALHARNTLISCASEGARYGARAGATLTDGEVRARDLVTASLSARYADDVSAAERVVDGVRVVEVRVRAPVPVIGLLGPDGALDVRGRAFLESQ
ncbi:MAG: TadE/TadG family type IV pilus assembly protein [Dermatophilaceae bacterium]